MSRRDDQLLTNSDRGASLRYISRRGRLNVSVEAVELFSCGTGTENRRVEIMDVFAVVQARVMCGRQDSGTSRVSPRWNDGKVKVFGSSIMRKTRTSFIP
jgi:hypothetical protein